MKGYSFIIQQFSYVDYDMQLIGITFDDEKSIASKIEIFFWPIILMIIKIALTTFDVIFIQQLKELILSFRIFYTAWSLFAIDFLFYYFVR